MSTHDHTPLAQRRTQIVERLIANQLDIHPLWRDATDWIALCDLESRRGAGPVFGEQERAYRLLIADFERTLTGEQQTAFANIIDLREGDLNAIEQRTAFELGRDFGTAATRRRPALERFIDFLQGHPEARHPLVTEYGAEQFTRNVRALLPFIPAIVLSGGWLEWTETPIATAIDALKTSEREAAQAGGDAPYLADDPDMIKTEELEAHYLTGLLVGLAISEVL